MSLIQSKERDGTISMRVSGQVSREPKALSKSINFSVLYKKDGFIEVSAWKDSECGELAQTLSKGDRVAVDGVFRSYQGKNSKTYYEVTADFIEVMGGAAPRPAAAQPPVQPQMEELEEDGELPF